MMNSLRTSILLTFLMFFLNNIKAANYDIVIYGATGSGVTAAIAAAKEGMKVLLIEPGGNIGGMVTGGLSNSDLGNTGVIGGLTLQFYKETADYYHATLFNWPGPEPHVAESIMNVWLKKNNVDIWFNRRIETAVIEKKVIKRIILSDKSEVKAQVFIDAGYEGDLMARAGVSYTWGREGRKEYNESYAGLQPVTFTSHQMDTKLNPFDNSGKLLPLINARKQVELGEGDKGIQSYCFRMVITDVPENKLPWTKPENYRPETYELARRYYKAKPDAPALFRFWPALPNRKCDVNSSIGISTNLPDGSSWDYPDAGYAKRDSIRQWHKDYTLGLAWFLLTDSVVPQRVKEFVKSVGLCKDEFVNTQNFPHQLYVREARRMIGEYFMTQHDLMKDTIKYDAIGMGSYNIDIREMQRIPVKFSRYPKLEDEVYNEGYMSIPVSPYQIPYRCIIPKYDECQNLIVPVCISASHVAFASYRMEPQFMIAGQSAGIAAAMAVKSQRPVQQIDIYALQAKLIKEGQILSIITK